MCDSIEITERAELGVGAEYFLKSIRIPNDWVFGVLLASQERYELSIQVPERSDVQHALKVAVVHVHRSKLSIVQFGELFVEFEHAHRLRTHGVVHAQRVLPLFILRHYARPRFATPNGIGARPRFSIPRALFLTR